MTQQGVWYRTYPGDKSGSLFGDLFDFITRVVYSEGVVYNVRSDTVVYRTH